jgi:hypothetical protein
MKASPGSARPPQRNHDSFVILRSSSVILNIFPYMKNLIISKPNYQEMSWVELKFNDICCWVNKFLNI